ncbi:hypothetical protein VTJ83DRAFT_5978 [Remersonia thermophila]|uniref:DNA-(apurinic or apyrimidinic site) lyase n=1 Tax=Remersonia thermophila TaxID=72144 RepID=A0ABR4D8I3_9PEZI
MQKISEWRKLPLSLSELCIDTTLRCGQSFRWRKISDEWHCVLRGRLVSLKQDATHLHYRVTWPPKATLPITPPASVPPAPADSNGTTPSKDASSNDKNNANDNDNDNDDDTAALLHHYFALSHSARALYDQWAASDANFARRAPAFTGIRILNQDAWEALVAFICSSNNNIARIGQMVQKLCLHWGPHVATVAGEPFHDFPAPEALAREGDKTEARLRELGFGYRAKYIVSTARQVALERPAGWLLGLRNPECPDFGQAAGVKDDAANRPTYRAAHDALLELAGVGPKVADCVCLMGLGWGEAVPIDTHVWQIAQRDYKFGGGKGTKTLSKAMYDAVGDHFRKIWGPQAGWAQSVLFTANLKSFSEQASSSPVKAKAQAKVAVAAVDAAAVPSAVQPSPPESGEEAAPDGIEGEVKVVEETAVAVAVEQTTSGSSSSRTTRRRGEQNKAAVAPRQTRKRAATKGQADEARNVQEQAAETGRVTRRASKRLRGA